MIAALAITTPVDFLFSVFLGIIASLLAIVLTVFAAYALKKMIEVGSNINEEFQSAGRIRRTTGF